MKKKDTFIKILPVIIIILIIAMAIFAIVSVGRMLLKNANNNPTVTQTNILRQALLTADNDRSVKMTVRGPIVAQENFRSYQIRISPTNRLLTTYKGYLGEQIGQVSLDNNIPAYEQFINSLDKAALANSTPFTAEDLNGICATGTVTEFDIMQGEKSLAHLWTSTCSGSKGSLKASVDQVKNLFLAQIPDYSKTLSTAGIR
ncbi:MAG: hypothetical protein Q3996_00605 [Candidatus Saccharibacteria bacterium]|nr:hypothetical protein [Candidatus Saccharibacteria bacterium]